MLRILISGCAVVVLLLSMLLLPQTASARRCPVKEPETLLSLYQSSDAIYVAAFDRMADEAIVEQNEDYTAVDISKHFTIISTLKGETRKFLVLKERDYRYPKTYDEVGMEDVEDPDDAPVPLKNGDQVLLFINNGDEEEGPRLADYRDGLKRLETREMGVYETRIRELHSIFSAKKVNEDQVLEWLIRCAEDPATLWEASYELLSSFEAADWAERRAERIKELKERKERGEVIDDDELIILGDFEEAGEPGERKFFDTAVLPKLLSDHHKQRLANILFESVAEGGDDQEAKEREEVPGEEELIDLVKRWGDDRLVPFLLDRLRGDTGDPWYSARIMGMVAEVLDDEDAKAAAERYAEISSEDDEETVEPEADGEETEAVIDEESAETPENEDPEAEQPIDDGTGDEPIDEAADDGPPVKKKTYGELRKEMLVKFLELCDRLITEKAENAESAN
ncbi:MAG: hypothetical protein AB7Q37_12245 [Pyrinomonadaceae bacterium]